MAFVPLFCRSHFSPLGVSSPAELVKRARALGHTSLGLMDEATLAGFHEFDVRCRENGIKPIFGCRLWADSLVGGAGRWPLDFIIKNETGYRNLARIVTAYFNLREEKPDLPTQMSLKGRAGGLVVVLPPDGELAELVSERDRKQVERYLATAIEYFENDIALGVDLPEGLSPDEAQDEMDRLRDVAEFINIPVIAAPKVYFAESADAPAFEYLCHPEGPPGEAWNPPEHDRELPALFAEADLQTRFRADPEAFAATDTLAAHCNKWSLTLGIGRSAIPMPFFERGFDPNSFLFDLVIRGAAQRYGEIGDEVKARINREFDEIKKAGHAPYLLFYKQIIDFLDETGIARGVGRGPVLASVVAYCLNLTRLDPFKYRLAPQPLAAPGERHAPIRLEVPGDGALKVLKWLKSTLGENHAARLTRRQEARRETLNAELAEWARLGAEDAGKIAAERKRRKVAGVAARLADMAEAHAARRWRDPAFLADLSDRLASRPRAIVASGSRWTVTAEALEMTFPTLLNIDGERIVDLTEPAVDQLGGIRIEFVPHHLLTLLDRTRACATQSSPGETFHQIPLDDRATFDLIARGDTTGIAPFENVTLKSLLRRDKPADILNLLKAKTEAGRGRAVEKPRELVDDLSDVLMAYQLAWFKAHHPAAFYAAALSSAAEDGRELEGLVRAIRRAKIRILPPDINLSGPLCGVYAGEIRLGLLMVRGMSERALEEIQNVRLGGRFNTLRELCTGLSPKSISPRVLQGLLGAGAFDGFGQNRAQMSAALSKLVKRTGSAAQDTLFDLAALEAEEAAAQEPAWDPATRARRERDALGFALADDPMSAHARTLRALRPLMADQVPARRRKPVRVAGLIDHIDAEGPLAGIEGACFVDLEGVAVYLNPELARVIRGSLKPGLPVVVFGRAASHERYPRIEAEGVWPLAVLDAQSERAATVRLDLSGENPATLRHLLRVVREFPGASRIQLRHYKHFHGLAYQWLSRCSVFFCAPLYEELCKILVPSQVEVFDISGQPLEDAWGQGGDNDASEE